VIFAYGGGDLLAAEEVCKVAGVWLVVVHADTGEVNRVIYNP
jgi:hypothetical protein